MRTHLVIAIAGLVGAALVPPASSSSVCRPITIRAEVEVAGGELTLRDLIEPGVTPAVGQAAKLVHLGIVPQPGSARVLAGSEVRTLLYGLVSNLDAAGKPACGSWQIPERITVRRARDSASCAELVDRVRDLLPTPVLRVRPTDQDCGSAGRIPQDAPIELVRAAWNSVQANWEILIRCVHSSDCVPFLVHLHGTDPESQTSARLNESVFTGSFNRNRSGASVLEAGRAVMSADIPLVRPGQTLTLIWDQDGIRVSVPVLCLDPGRLGQLVRARILSGGTMVRAVVAEAGILRIVS